MRRDSNTRERDGPAESVDPFSLLVVTSFRPEETRNATAHMDAATRVVTVDGDGGALAKLRATTRKTRTAIQEFDPDVLLLDAYGTIGAPAASVAARHGVPVVARLVSDIWRLSTEDIKRSRRSGSLSEYAMYRASHGLTSLSLRLASGYVAVSTELREVTAHQTGTPRSRIGVVPVPVTNESVTRGSAQRARRSYGITEQRVVLTVTNLGFEGKYEGARQTVRALEPLLRDKPDLGYVVAGGGSYHDDLFDAIDETATDPSVRDRIYAPGFVDDIADLYALGDVFVYVSYLDGYPNAVLEAQTAGLPVVANAAHGMRDQVTDGRNGLLVDGHDREQIRKSVESLLSDGDRRRRLGDGARERVSRENAPRAVSDRLEAFLGRFLDDRR